MDKKLNFIDFYPFFFTNFKFVTCLIFFFLIFFFNFKGPLPLMLIGYVINIHLLGSLFFLIPVQSLNLLLNGLVFIHPFLYITVYLLWSQSLCKNIAKKNKLFLSKVNNEMFLLTLWAFLLISAGCFWSIQELNWGFFWSWDVIEKINFFILVTSLMCFHNTYTILKNSLFYYCSYLFYFFAKFFLDTSQHNFLGEKSWEFSNFLLNLSTTSLIYNLNAKFYLFIFFFNFKITLIFITCLIFTIHFSFKNNFIIFNEPFTYNLKKKNFFLLNFIHIKIIIIVYFLIKVKTLHAFEYFIKKKNMFLILKDDCNYIDSSLVSSNFFNLDQNYRNFFVKSTEVESNFFKKFEFSKKSFNKLLDNLLFICFFKNFDSIVNIVDFQIFLI